MSDIMQTAETLIIHRGNLEAGVLKRTEEGCSFEYSKDFLSNRTYAGLSYKILKAPDPLEIRGINLPPFFAGLLPEGLRLKALVKNSKTSEDDLFTLFGAVGGNVIGDVFAPTKARQVQTPPKLREIDFYDYFKSLLDQDSYALGDEAFAGVQEKISAAMISFPLNVAKSTRSYILKLNPPDKLSLVQNEFIITNIAQKCEIETSNLKIVKDRNDNEGLLVERFDRVWDERTQTFGKVHQEDACQFLNRYPADKYKLTMAEIVKGMQAIATAKQAATLTLLRVFCFSYLVGNGDLHAKNISLFDRPNEKGVTDITPAYDLLTTIIYGDERMALKFDGKDDNINRQMVISFGERFGIPHKATANMLDRLISKMDANRFLLESIPVDGRAATRLSNLVTKRLNDLKA